MWLERLLWRCCGSYSPNAPPPRKNEVDPCMLIDSNHAGNKQTRRSRIRFMFYMNMSLINWYSKKQSTIETLLLGTGLVSLTAGMETLHAIWYKLRMMGIPISGISYIYGDNMLVFHNITKLESTVKKKYNAIAYHAVCKPVAMEASLAWYIQSKDNPGSYWVVTGQKWNHLVSLALYNI